MSIAQKAARGVAWNMAFGLGSRVLQLIGTLILTRFINPDASGAVTEASIMVATASAFTSFSFGQFLIAQQAPASVAAQAMVIHMALGVIAMAVVYELRFWLNGLLNTESSVSMAPYVL